MRHDDTTGEALHKKPHQTYRSRPSFRPYNPWKSSPRKHGPKAGLGQNASHDVTVIPLNLDMPVFDGTSHPCCALNGFGQGFLFWQSDPHKPAHHDDRFASAMGFLTDDIHSTPVFLNRLRRV